MDFIDIIGTIYDNSVEHTAVIASLVKDLKLNRKQEDINEDIYNLILIAKEYKDKAKGYYDSYESLILNFPLPEIGDWAIVKNPDDGKRYIYKCVVRGYWKATDEEYISEINLSEYPKRSEFKTINGVSIFGEGDIETGDRYEIASQNNDGLLSKEFYVQLLEMRNETLPEIQEHIDNLLLLFDDEQTPENILEIIDRYNQICEFISSLGDSNEGEILEQIVADISRLKSSVESIESDITNNVKRDLTNAKDDIALLKTKVLNLEESSGVSTLEERVSDVESDVTELKNKVHDLEEQADNPSSKDSIKHIIITESEYEQLSEYEEDALYIIVENDNWELGDGLPIILS